MTGFDLTSWAVSNLLSISRQSGNKSYIAKSVKIGQQKTGYLSDGRIFAKVIKFVIILSKKYNLFIKST
jgi:hypothetical protein